MSTMFFGASELARVIVYLDASVDDVLAFSQANAKAFNGMYRESVHAPEKEDLLRLADEEAKEVPSTRDVMRLLQSVGLFRYNTDDFQSECDEALTRIEAKAFHLTRYLDTMGSQYVGDDYRERRESERAR